MVVKGLRASKQLLEGAKQISTHGNTKEFQKTGGVHEAFQDFMSLKLSSARNFRSWDGVIKLIEPCHEKTKILVSDLVRHKPDCTATEDG